MRVRPLVTADLADVARIERASYSPQLRESDAAFLAKMALFRAGALGCWDDDGLCGYAFAVPWTRDAVIPVAQVLDRLPAAPEVLYIHDMVVAPERRGTGVASALFRELLRLADGLSLDTLALVAVQGSEPFWRKLGFEAVERFEYAPGQPATRMSRPAASCR